MSGDVWLVHRRQTVHGQDRAGAEVFHDETTAWEWANTYPHGPNEQRTVQRKTPLETADATPAGEHLKPVTPTATPWQNSPTLFDLEAAS